MSTVSLVLVERVEPSLENPYRMLIPFAVPYAPKCAPAMA